MVTNRFLLIPGTGVLPLPMAQRPGPIAQEPGQGHEVKTTTFALAYILFLYALI